MPLKVWDGSAWQVQAQLKVWNGSSWVPTNELNNAKSARVWNGSSWVQFHPGVQIEEYPSPSSGMSLYKFDIVDNGDTAFAQTTIELNSNGTLYITDQGSYNFSWLLTGANSDYYAYMDAPTGSSFTSGTTGSALQLNTTRTWILEISNSINNSMIFSSLSSTLRLRNSAGTDILSVTVGMYVEAQVGIPP